MQKVVIADDHPLFRGAVREVLVRLMAARNEALTVLEAAHTGELFAIVASDDDLDLILLDLFMPGSDALADLALLRARAPGTPVVVISSLEDASVVRRVMAGGAAGYIVKSASKESMTEALATVLNGGVHLPLEAVRTAQPAAAEGPMTPRQSAVLALLAKGRSNKQIARELDITEVTVKAHMTAILRKLGVDTRAQAIVAFQGSLALGAQTAATLMRPPSG